MKKIYAVIITISLLSSSSMNVKAQTFDKKYYAGTGNYGSGFSMGYNSTLLMSGYTLGATNNWQITRVDSLGSVLSSWSYDFGGVDGDCNIKQAIDSGYVIFGQSTNPPSSLIKVSKTGVVLWTKRFTAGTVGIQDVLVLNDGTYIVTSPKGLGFGLIHLDASGNILWANSSGSQSANSVILNAAGNYVATGWDFSQNVVVAEFDANGNVLWSAAFQGINPSFGYKIVQTTDNGYAVNCYQNGTEYMIKISQIGTLLWTIVIPTTTSSNTRVGLVALPSNKTLVSYTNPSSPYSINIEEINATGNSVTDYKITTPILNPYAYANVVRKSNGEIFVRAINNGSTNMFELVKLNSNYTGCAVTSIGTNTPSIYNFATPIASPALGTMTPAVTSPTVTFSNTATSTISVCSTNALAVSPGQTNILCNGQCNGSATVTPSGGQTPYTYSWSPGGQTTPTRVNLCAGTYSCLVSDAFGITVVTTVNITQPATPVTLTTTASSNSICSGNSVTLTVNGSGGTGSITYTWQPGNLTNTSVAVSPLGTTIYTVTGKDANNCTTTTNISLTVKPSPTIAVNSGSICSGSSFTIIPSGANTFTIQGGSAVVSPTANASYTVVGTSTAGCVSASSATSNITVNALPTISVNSGSICSGSSFTIIPSGANTYTIQGGSAVVSPTANATYTVSGTSTQGCVSASSATSNITVNATPTISVNSGSICSGQTFTMVSNGASTYTFQGGSAVVSPSANASYTVTGTNTVGCVSASPAMSNVTVSPTPTISVVGGVICTGGSFTFSPSGANTYTYSGGQIVSPAVTTSYTITGTSTAGCVSQNAVATITVANNLTVIITGANTVCAGSPINLTAGGAATYTWNTGATTTTIAPTPTVNTTYTVTGASGSCSNTAVKSVTVNSLPTISASTSNTLICTGQSATLTASGANTYTWNPGGAGTNISVSPTVTTTYTITGTSALSCNNTSTFTQSVSACAGLSSVALAKENFNVYPNPSSGIVNVTCNTDKFKIEIFNSLGELVSLSFGEGQKGESNISSQPSGIYFIKVGYITKKIIKE